MSQDSGLHHQSGKGRCCGAVAPDIVCVYLDLARQIGPEHPASLDLTAVKKAINELRHEFRTLLPIPEVERNTKVEATLESIRKKLYAASYASGGQGQDWLKLFNAADKDNSGSLGFEEFRIAVRKGARLSPTIVSDIELKQIFTAMDVDGSKTIEAG